MSEPDPLAEIDALPEPTKTNALPLLGQAPGWAGELLRVERREAAGGVWLTFMFQWGALSLFAPAAK